MIVNRYLKASSFKVNVGIHVGAHIADEAIKYENLKFKHVVWFEADDQTAHWARETLACRPAEAATKHTLIEALVTDVDGVEMDFHVFNNHGGSSSIFASTALMREHFPKLRETGEVKRLRSARLDTLLTDVGVDPADVDMMVFDVQGAELLCLRGAGAYLDTATFIEVEVSKEQIYAGGALAAEVEALLLDKGFTRVSDVPWHGDAVYVRADRMTQTQLEAMARLQLP